MDVGSQGSRWDLALLLVMCWSPSIFLPFILSQGLIKDPKQDSPLWLEETQLSSTPGHRSIIAACKHSSSWVRRRLFLAGDMENSMVGARAILGPHCLPEQGTWGSSDPSPAIFAHGTDAPSLLPPCRHQC